MENCEFRNYLKICLSHRVKELFKLIQTWYGVFPVKVELQTKIYLGIACLGKKFGFSYGILRDSRNAIFCEI